MSGSEVTVTVTVAVLAAVACGAAALAVRPLVARLPDPAYADVAAEPGLRARAVGCATVTGALVGAAVGRSWALLFLLPLVPVGTALALVDLHTRLLPSRLVRPALAGVVVLGCLAGLLAGDIAAIIRAATAAGAVFAVFFAMWWIYPPGLGYGDVRVAPVLGFALGWLGWGPVLVGFYGALLAFAVPGLLLALVRRDRGVLATAYPFGPFLLGGAVLGVVVGDPLWAHLVAG